MDDICIIEADCLTALAELPDASVDTVVTDPPYGLEFMGKEWDSFGWQTGSGFSKPGIGDRPTEWPSFTGCNDVFGGANPTCATCGGRARGKRKCDCEEPDWKVKGDSPDPMYGRKRQMASFQQWNTGWATAVLRVLKPGGYMLCFGGTRTYHRLACAVEDAGFEIRDCLMWIYGSGFPKGKGCLKPAYEPILLCRRPGVKVLPLGIEECRVEYVSDSDKSSATPQGRCTSKPSAAIAAEPDAGRDMERIAFERPALNGRWPANLVHDGSDEVMDRFAEFGESGGGKFSRKTRPRMESWRQMESRNDRLGQVEATDNYGDTGTAARFFYCAKASRSERGEGNSHPTVKPLALMEWLIKLVAREGDTVLDPFLGSGTTAQAALNTGRKCIGIERHGPYAEIARRRVTECVGALFAEAV